MNTLAAHLRNKFLAGALAAIPIGIVVYGAVWLEAHTRPVATILGLPHFPGLGVLMIVLAVYLLGLVVTSLVGGFFLRAMDYLLERIPGFKFVYRTWKDVTLQPAGKTGTFDRVVLVPNPQGAGLRIGFTSGEVIGTDPPRWCVFVPTVPNPLAGELVLLPCGDCVPLEVSVEGAFKFLLSSGSYLPAGLIPAIPSGQKAESEGTQ